MRRECERLQECFVRSLIEVTSIMEDYRADWPMIRALLHVYVTQAPEARPLMGREAATQYTRCR